MGYDTEEVCILCFSVWFLAAFFYVAWAV